MNAGEGPTGTAGRTVRVVSKNLKTAGVLLRDEMLDKDGRTVSVLGCKSGIPGRSVGEVVLITLANNVVIPGVITHIHAVHDRFRASVDAARLPPGLHIAPSSDIEGGVGSATPVDVVDPG